MPPSGTFGQHPPFSSFLLLRLLLDRESELTKVVVFPHVWDIWGPTGDFCKMQEAFYEAQRRLRECAEKGSWTALWG